MTDKDNEEIDDIEFALGITDPDAFETSFYFFHGKESGPFGTKYRLLKERFTDIESPDFQGMTLAERVAHADEFTKYNSGGGILGRKIIVGSSFGGLVAALLYSKYPDRFDGLVLLAPAFHLAEASDIERLPSPEKIRVIHGRQDDVVPLDAVKTLCQKFGIPVIEVDDDHRLHASMNLAIEMVEQINCKLLIVNC